MTLKRYDQETVSYGIGQAVEMVESPEGGWLAYADLVAVLADNETDKQYIREAKIVLAGLLLSPIN